MTATRITSDVASRLAALFADKVMGATDLPAARVADLCESLKVTEDTSVLRDYEGRELAEGNTVLRLTCTITGSSKELIWDGAEADALALIDDLADETAFLVTRTPHYAWMRSRV